MFQLTLNDSLWWVVFLLFLHTFCEVSEQEGENMTSIEFGKKCQPLNKQYKDIFGYVPCRGDYICNQEEYFDALCKSIKEKISIDKLLPKCSFSYSENKRP